ncbi:MAG TPA: hypothetical protein VF012_03725 [Nocardioidaceae bacterium]
MRDDAASLGEAVFTEDVASGEGISPEHPVRPAGKAARARAAAHLLLVLMTSTVAART